jgi:dTMP kinase
MPGKYIILDGIDFCGKGTQLFKLAEYIFSKDKRNTLAITREPTYGVYGAEIRKILAEEKDPYKGAEKCFDLYVSDRIDHIKRVIMPAYESKHIILQDRGKYSTYAYQTAQGIEPKRIIEAHKGIIAPDLAVIINITADEARKRAEKAGRPKEKFEDPTFLEKVRENFSKVRSAWPNEDIVYVNGMQSPDDVFDEIKLHVDIKLKS